jgi:hypothetical protein
MQGLIVAVSSVTGRAVRVGAHLLRWVSGRRPDAFLKTLTWNTALTARSVSDPWNRSVSPFSLNSAFWSVKLFLRKGNGCVLWRTCALISFNLELRAGQPCHPYILGQSRWSIPAYYLLHAGVLLGIFFGREDGSKTILRNVDILPIECVFYYFINLVCEAIGTAATTGLLCQPVEKQMGCRLAGETEVLGENLPQRHFCPSQNPTLLDSGLNLAAAVGSRRLTAWAMAQPIDYIDQSI